MISFKLNSPQDIMLDLASRLRDRRIAENLTQKDLASTAGVSYGAVRSFEKSGEGAFETLVKIAFALNAETEFEQLFPAPMAETLNEWIGESKRQRVRKS